MFVVIKLNYLPTFVANSKLVELAPGPRFATLKYECHYNLRGVHSPKEV
jgi:hypothetical protein